MTQKVKFQRKKFRQETFFHSFLVRPLAQEIVALLWNTNITPNQVSIFRIILNIISLFCFAYSEFLIGFILFQAHEIIDHADGMLARMKNLKSKWGAVLEVTSDTLFSTVFGFMGLSFAIAGFREEGNPYYFLFFGIIAMSYCYGSYFGRLAAGGEGSGGIHMNHDEEEYIALFPGSLKKMIVNWVKTAFTWQNQFLLWGGLLYFPLKEYGINSLMIGFVCVCILIQAYWINMLFKILKSK